MSKALSIYLDAIRFTAAVLVVLTHLRHEKFTGGPLKEFIGNSGNEAVMIFFVLSGFVIAYTVDTKDRNLRDYMLSRMARLYSVALPALVLTVILDQTGRLIDYGVYDWNYYRGNEHLIRFVANLLFVNELWFVSIRPWSNGPYWSLGYEFWYYVIFGIVVFMKGKPRIGLVTVACIIIGPKILLLFPIWLLGVATYHVAQRQQIPRTLGWLLFAGSIAAVVVYAKLGVKASLDSLTVAVLGRELCDRLLWSQFFISSYLIAAMIAANFIGFSCIADNFDSLFRRLEKPIRYLASFTLTTYLLHFPLMLFFVTLLPGARQNYFDRALLLLAVAASIFVIGIFTEHKKHIARNLLTKVFEKFGFR
jgi:peptidoglycan/LPS O-acetylase OafA/YrhL